MSFLYPVLVIAGCIALASLLTALLSWRGKESKWVYTVIFLVLCYFLIITAIEFLVTDGKPVTPWQEWQNIYQQIKDDKKSAPKDCKNKTVSAAISGKNNGIA